MRRLLIIAVASLFGLQATQAQEEYGVFDHLGIGISAGLDGIGFDLAAPITDWAAVRAGMSFMPGIKYDFEVDPDSNDPDFILNSNKKIDVTGKLNMTDFKLLFDFYPIQNSGFHLTAGAYIGSKKVVTAKNKKQFLVESAWGTSGVKIGPYRATSDDDGNVEATIEVAGFKPYLGIGFGRAVPKNNISVSCDLGVKFWGKPGVYAWTNDNFGNRIHTKLTKEDVDNDDADKAFDILSKISVFPVLNIRLCGKLF